MDENARYSAAMGVNDHCSEGVMVESKRDGSAHFRTSETEVVPDSVVAHLSCFLGYRCSDDVDRRLCADQLACAVSISEPVEPAALQ